MAQRMRDDEQGYDERRFEGTISEDLFCSICQAVLRNPRTCHKEHAFCHFCISEHLRHSHTCPECREHLTPETLKNPPRFMKNTLAGLKIKCEYSERGCPGFVLLESLQNHVDKCGFAPVTCKNEGCGMEVNKRDKDLHEKDLCEFRIAKCHDCKEIRASQEETKKTVEVMKQSQAEMKVESNKMKDSVDEVKVSQRKIKTSQDKIKSEWNKIKDCVHQMKVSQDETKEKVDEMRRSQARFEAEVKQQLERMTEMMNQLLQGNNLNNKINGASAREPATVENNQDVIIIGGWYGPKDFEILNTVEKYNIVERKSTSLPRLSHPRAASASCVYSNDVLVVGGYDGKEGLDKIEVLKMNQHPLRWTMFDGKLPVTLYAHDVIVYQGKLYIIGGYDGKERKTSNAIYEIALTPPYTAKLLTRMPEARRYARAELVNGKLFILGGTTTIYSKDALDSVVVYDLIKNEFKPCPSLPQPVFGMSTVTWGHMIIVVGGLDKNWQALNDVIMYDTETGRSERLPSMIHKRSGSSVVIMNDVIFTFGGWNEKQGYLNSVESFTIGGDGWKELPGMIEKRNYATAVVKPHN
ncbi:spermatocyte protein spe-26-like isoform X1 [Dendronephthya gigantea]|uniref:spermatocyte protein spe-26-like isoform X1 n=1 Tax=Dendronephthya gigantea TaxID=151771 RepID=UPI001069FABF|nr:spermatocyte protein spe-26-like isoform X1 [Dendronephthya gigantea]XP_028414497.1 spermatocyte protein spe-26-like isoform X1 [Dendronephthya gigantea]